MNASPHIAVINSSRPLGIAGKQFSNPRRLKPATGADVELADELAAVVAELPDRITPARDTRFPLLTAIAHSSRAGAAARLVFIAARIHHWADERRTAEYLLRHRDELRAGTRSPASLLGAARCAAEMDVRRVRSREIPCTEDSLARREPSDRDDRLDDPSVPDAVVAYARELLGTSCAGPLAWSRLHDAVVIATELAERIAVRHGAVILSMRSDARASSRLSHHLQAEFGDHNAARSLARLLVGSDDAPVESALLWWVAHRDADPAGVAQRLRARWARDLADADPTMQTRRARRRNSRQQRAAARQHVK